MAQRRRATSEIVGRFRRNGKAGALDVALRGILEPGTPAGSDLEYVVARLDVQLLETVVELPPRRLAERLVGRVEHALRVEGMLTVEKAQEEVRIDVVVVGNCAAIRAHLPEQQRLEEAPRGHGIVPIAHRAANLEGTQHVAFE